MKKHIIGLTLFSFIVGVAAIACAVFNVPEIVQVAAPQYVPAEGTHCKMQRELKQSEINKPIVAQAVYSVKTKKLSWEVDKLNLKKGTVLHWVLVDGKGIEKLTSFYATEYLIGSQGEFNVGSTSLLSEIVSEISRNANLYLVIDTKSGNGISNEMKRMEAFDINKAVPVTIDYSE